MDRHAFFSRTATKTTIVNLDDEGATVTVRKLSQADYELVAKKSKKDEGEGMRYLVSRTLLDDAGNLLCEHEGDVANLVNIDAGTINTIGNAVLAFSGLMPKSKDDAKNA